MTDDFSKRNFWEFRFILPGRWESGEVSTMIIETHSEERALTVFSEYYSEVLTDSSEIRVISVKSLWISVDPIPDPEQDTQPRLTPELTPDLKLKPRTNPTSSRFVFSPATPKSGILKKPTT